MSTLAHESSPFSRFMASCNGRISRLGLGFTLIVLGLEVIGGGAGIALAAFGLVPTAAGVFNLCPIAPLWGGHFLGSRYCAVPARRGPDTLS